MEGLSLMLFGVCTCDEAERLERNLRVGSRHLYLRHIEYVAFLVGKIDVVLLIA